MMRACTVEGQCCGVQTSKIKNLTIQLPIVYLAAPKSGEDSDDEERNATKNNSDGGTPGSKDSDGSFLKDLEETLKEGAADVVRGEKLFGRKKKRDRHQANQKGGKEGKLNYANLNDPILILNELPQPTREALMAMSATAGEACLIEYLNRHTNMLHNELNKATVHKQNTMYDKFLKLKQYMEVHGIAFEPQTDFY